MKRLQNRIAESGIALPVTVVYGIAVWLLSGLLKEGWWPQFVCYGVGVYLLIMLSHSQSLLRIRSHMVTCTFIALSSMACTLFGSLTGQVTQLFCISALLMLFTIYQNDQATGRVFYAFAFLGIASMMHVQILWLVPVIWLLMAFQLMAFSWRIWTASVIGLITPYWFLSVWFVYLWDFSPLLQHFTPLWEVGTPFDYSRLTIGQWAAYGLTAVLTLTGIVHFWHRSYEDKIRIRLFYGFFTYLGLLCLLIIAILPHHYDPFIRLAFVCASPLVAHFMALTSTRITNIAFFVITALTVLVTILNLWMPSFCLIFNV